MFPISYRQKADEKASQGKEGRFTDAFSRTSQGVGWKRMNPPEADSRATENSGLTSNKRTVLPSVQRDLATFVQHIFSFSGPVTIMGYFILSFSK